MYNNIGGKIKGLTKVIAVLGALAPIAIGLGLMFNDDDTFFLGLVIIVVGCLISWISSWLLYGFGDLIENTALIARNTQAMYMNEYANQNANRQSELYRLYSTGTITAEEYQKAMAGNQQVPRV